MRKHNSLTSVQALLARSGKSHTVLLTSFRRNGQEIGGFGCTGTIQNAVH